MSVPVRIAAYVAVLAAVFAVAFGIGSWVGPVATEPPRHTDGAGHDH